MINEQIDSAGSPRAQTEAPIEAIRAFMEKWPEVERIVNGYISLHFARTQVQYSGPSLAPELDRFRAILSASPGSPLEEDALGLSVDMLDVDRLKKWADNIETHGPDLTHWASPAFVAGWLRGLADRLDTTVREIGILRAPGSPWRPKEEQEICICAALQLIDGRVIRGHRHDDCIQTATKWRDAGQVIEHGEQGFVTSRNRFVGRAEAYELQVAAGLFQDRPGARILMSEDLY